MAGGTGAGKTSLLNAILGYQEFLPSSCEQAATAVVCEVAWNHDETPGNEFKAEVTFHNVEDVKAQLKNFFDAIDDLKEVLAKDYTNEDERTADTAQAQQAIDQYLDQIQAVWDLGQDDLQNLTADKVLASNPSVLKLLGTTLYLNDSDPDALSQKVRPYLDSTKHQHGGDTDSEAFAAWPLVKQVRQFLRADILKNGIKLVDLPGLADMSDSRAAVAESFYSKLNLTMIVSPIIRAADEKTGGDLLDRCHEQRLKMDGKFDKKGLVFVLSKADDINIQGCLKRSHGSENNNEAKATNVELKDLDQDLANVENQLRAEQKTLSSLQRMERKKFKAVGKISQKHQDAKPSKYSLEKPAWGNLTD